MHADVLRGAREDKQVPYRQLDRFAGDALKERAKGSKANCRSVERKAPSVRRNLMAYTPGETSCVSVVVDQGMEKYAL